MTTETPPPPESVLRRPSFVLGQMAALRPGSGSRRVASQRKDVGHRRAKLREIRARPGITRVRERAAMVRRRVGPKGLLGVVVESQAASRSKPAALERRAVFRIREPRRRPFDLLLEAHLAAVGREGRRAAVRGEAKARAWEWPRARGRSWRRKSTAPRSPQWSEMGKWRDRDPPSTARPARRRAGARLREHPRPAVEQQPTFAPRRG